MKVICRDSRLSYVRRKKQEKGTVEIDRLSFFLEYLAVDGVFWYTKHVHYTLVWILLWN
jgi:hypothetical protein